MITKERLQDCSFRTAPVFRTNRKFCRHRRQHTPAPPDKDLLKPIGPVKPYHKNRPKAPGIYDVYAWTEAGTLTVQFVRPAGTCEMTVTSDYGPTGQTYTFSSEMSFSTTVDTTGPELYIEIVTEEGTTYIGDIPVE